jgi:hypothetical protein
LAAWIQGPAVLLGEGETCIGATREMPDNPKIVHPVTWSRDLRMVRSGRNGNRITLSDFVNEVTHLCVAVTGLLREPVMIDLRLGVMVWRITRPTARIIYDFA